jgi:hypothetical protein
MAQCASVCLSAASVNLAYLDAGLDHIFRAFLEILASVPQCLSDLYVKISSKRYVHAIEGVGGTGGRVPTSMKTTEAPRH